MKTLHTKKSISKKQCQLKFYIRNTLHVYFSNEDPSHNKEKKNRDQQGNWKAHHHSKRKSANNLSRISKRSSPQPSSKSYTRVRASNTLEEIATPTVKIHSFTWKFSQNTVLVSKIKEFYIKNLSPNEGKTSEDLSYCFKSKSIKITGSKAFFYVVYETTDSAWSRHLLAQQIFYHFPYACFGFAHNWSVFHRASVLHYLQQKKRWLQSSSKRRNCVFFLSYKQHPHTIPYYYASSAPPTYFHPGRWVGVSKFGKCNYSYIQLTELNVWSHSIWSDWSYEKHHSLQFHPKLVSKKALLILSVAEAFCCLVLAVFFFF